MGKFFQKLRRSCRGAVTVFVTLMLIPAVLVSGSGVDIARLYTARSEIRDANQLAANSALASYNALLQDLYGLFGIMKSDDELASMMDEYIKLALFGEDWNETGLGTYALFQGSAVSLGSVSAAPNKNLGNPEVLRRQIEEYVKFRAPAIIVREVLDKLDTFEKVKEDASVIQDKLDIEDKIEEIDKIYGELYSCIQEVNKAPQLEKSAFESVNSYIDRMERTIDELYVTRTNDYTEAVKAEEDDRAGDYEKKYEGLFDNLHDLAVGGKVREGYEMGHDGVLGYSKGSFRSSYNTPGLKKSIGDSKKSLEDISSNSTFADDSLKELVKLAKDADKKKEELSQMVDDLEAKLDQNKCSSELKEGLTVTKNSNGQTQIEFYRSMLSYNITNMATAMQSTNEPKLAAMVERLNNVGYGNPSLGASGFFSLDALKGLNENQSGYEIDLIIQNTERSKNGQSLLEDKLAYLDGISPVRFNAAGDYVLFQDISSESKEFYELLQQMYSNTEATAKKNDIKKGLEKVAGQIQSQFTGLLKFDPLGAYSYSRGGGGGSGGGSSFGSSGDWGGSGQIKKVTKNALNDNLLTRLSNAGNSAANKLLLLTYDSEMFSCYATNAGYSDPSKESAEPTEENMAGIPLGIKVNYYFQSELEYLYNGNLSSAKDNLKAVTGMILLIRFVLNYTISFTISVVNDTVRAVEDTLFFLGAGAIVIGELVRLVMALGESVTDVSRLKDGCKVVLFKRNGTDSNGKTIWRFSLSGLLSQLEEGIVGDLPSNACAAAGKDDDPDGFVYKDYMRLFLLLVDGDVLAQRTARLIELNVTNYRDGIGSKGDRSARESAMSAATLFEMNKAITDFSVTTTVNLKMLFLSSPIAQRGIVNGVVPPKTKEVTVTDYRGY